MNEYLVSSLAVNVDEKVSDSLYASKFGNTFNNNRLQGLEVTACSGLAKAPIQAVRVCCK